MFHDVLPETRPGLECQRGFENTRRVHGYPVCVIGDLMPAARPVGNDERLPRCLADCGQKVPLRHAKRNFFVLRFVAEGACHSAAAGFNLLDREAGNEFQRGHDVGHGPESLLVAMTVKVGFARVVIAAATLLRAAGTVERSFYFQAWFALPVF